MIHVLVGLLGAALVALMLVEFFVAYLLPRRVKRDPRVARQVHRFMWRPWRAAASRLPAVARDTMLGVFGPLGLVGVLALWSLGLIVGFAAIHWGSQTAFGHPAGGGFWDDLYFSASAFFSASNELAPSGGLAHFLNVAEAATGFGVFFIAIGYLPSLYQAYSRREIAVSQLDARAGSPPTAGRLLLDSAAHGGWAGLDSYLAEWENWAAELMETHLAYPALGFFRSQHVNQNWLAALTTVLDASAVALSAAPEAVAESARLAFAIGRHALADLALSFRAQLETAAPDRLPDDDYAALSRHLSEAGLELRDEQGARERLSGLRSMYEPYAQALAATLALSLPAWLPEEQAQPNWRLAAEHAGSSPGWHSHPD